MKNLKLSEVENLNLKSELEEFNSDAEIAKANIANATSAAQVKEEICNVWKRVRKYVIWAEHIPVVGKFIAILADVLDSICGLEG